MKQITKLAIVFMFITCAATFISCRSREEKVIHDLKNLAEKVNKNGKNFDAYDWEDAFDDLAEIHEDMADCEFTPEQLLKLGKVDGQLSVIIMREGSRAAGKSVTDFIRSAGSFFKGFEEGSKESYEENKDEFERIGNDVESSINEVLKELDDL